MLIQQPAPCSWDTHTMSVFSLDPNRAGSAWGGVHFPHSNPCSALLCTCSLDAMPRVGCRWAVLAQHQGSLQQPQAPRLGTDLKWPVCIPNHMMSHSAWGKGKEKHEHQSSWTTPTCIEVLLPKMWTNFSCWWEAKNNCFLPFCFQLTFSSCLVLFFSFFYL